MVSFLTPYWSGAEMMRIHLESVRRFHPLAPILISKRGGGAVEMESYRRDFGVAYWLEDCGYTNAYLRLLQRCPTRYVCILDHDTVLLRSVEPLLDGLRQRRYGLAGVEERVSLPRSSAIVSPGTNGWLRFSPGDTASNFLVFDWQAFREQWGLRGVFGSPSSGSRHFDFDYGIGQRLPDHHYLQPFHTERYGIGNLLTDGGEPAVWHQWYGSYRTRLSAGASAEERQVREVVDDGERAFLADYPDLKFGDLVPAWGPERDVAAEQRELRATSPSRSDTVARLRRSAGRQWRSAMAQVAVGLERP